MLGSLFLFSTLLLVLAGQVFGQVETLPYRRVVHFRDLINGLADINEEFQITDVSISANRWVALLSFRKGETNSILVSGDLAGADASVRRLEYRPTRAILDGQNRIYLQGDQRGRQRERAVFELEERGGRRELAQIPDDMVTPLRSGGEVLWSGAEGIWREQSSRGLKIKRPPPTNGAVSEVENELLSVLGLPGGRHLILRSRVETATVYDATGSVSSTAVLRFDQAYASIGRTSAPVDIHEVGSGRTRVIWATTSAAGELYVGLSETPIVSSVYVAVFDPVNGKFMRMLSVERPKGIAFRVFDENPDGGMLPSMGSVYERMVIADPEAGVVAFY